MGRGIGLSRLLILAIAIAAGPVPAFAYIQTVTPSGVPVHWPSGFTFNLAGNPSNAGGLEPGDFFNAVVHSLERWRSSSEGSVRFEYWQGTDRDTYIPNSDYNGLSSVYFASNATGPTGLSPNILGLTQVWYKSGSGQILEADTVLNDLDFVFTTDPTDTSGYGSGNMATGGSRAHVFVENVLTHEFGHSLGLAHSAGLQATMLFMESPEQAHLGCDEQTGIHQLYPSSDEGSRGSITGMVVSESGSPLFGAYVEAVSRVRGVSLGGGITDPKGRFRIAALEPGAYYLMVEPYLAGAAALPAFFSSINTAFCGGQQFRRTFLADATGHAAQAVVVHAGGETAVPPIAARCEPVDPISGDPTAPANDPGGFGIVDNLQNGGRTYQVQAVSGRLEIHAVGYSLYSPVHVSLELLNAGGAPVEGATISDDVYVGDSGYINYDSSVVADDLPSGDYVISAAPDTLGEKDYPAGPLMLDASPFVLITGSINEPTPPLASELAVNGRCRMDEKFAAYQSPPGNPPRNSVDNGGGGMGFCGTVNSPSKGSGGGGPGPGAIVGWLLPWLAMGALARMARRRLARAAAPG